MDEREGTRLKAAREISAALLEKGIQCDSFTANRIIANLWTAYQRGVEEYPGLKAAVLNGTFEIKRGI
ncbi:MAG: hypothetical protein BWX71_00737 [Deltaproteobacteria bacterium ADurb.Bin072]|nr:MAG: hypothetical protein BWX71_00737 [Deltaproteobacteria bacterium ADurb.Bin072]